VNILTPNPAWRPAGDDETPGGLTPELALAGLQVWSARLRVQMIKCSCGARDTPPHSITCLITAAGLPNAMVDIDGDVFYPDNPDDAMHFALNHHAFPLDLLGFGAWLAAED
jgi:hypothetical protein